VAGGLGPLNTRPQLVLPFAAIVPLYDAFAAVTAGPDTVTVAFHELAIVTPPASVNVTVQPEVGAVPVLVTFTSAWPPPDQEPVVVTVAVQPPDGAGEEDADRDGEEDTDREGEEDTDREGEEDTDRDGEEETDADGDAEREAEAEVDGEVDVLVVV
jgi:hypothetical protein